MKYIGVIFLVLAAMAAPALAETSGDIDWSAWQRLPVLHDGRIMPLDTMAIVQIKKVCGSVNPQIGMLGALDKADAAALSASEKEHIAADCKARRFSAPELLYAWIVEPEKWETIPFIYAEDKTLRADILEVPIFGEDGSRLKYVSPRQLLASTKFWQQIDELRRQQEDNPKAKHGPFDSQIKDLYDALVIYKQMTFDPSSPGMAKRTVSEGMELLVQEWMGLQQDLPRMPIMQQPAMSASIQEANDSVRELGSAWIAGDSARQPLVKIEPLVARVRKATSLLANRVADEIGTPADRKEGEKDMLRIAKRNLVDRTASVARLATQFHWNMFDGGGTLHVAPSMEPSSLEADRHRSDVQPWVSLPAVLYGSSELLSAYPISTVLEARKAWKDARAAYLDRDNPQRSEIFATAMQRFAAALRETSELIESDRQKLPLKEYDRFLIAKTAYPPAMLTDAECIYNQVDPFFWAWSVALASTSLLVLSLLGFRKTFFWCGVSALAIAIGWIVAGFMMRMFVTRWAPVTSMFDTIVWVTMCVSILTLWLTFLPMLGPSARIAWRLTALPGSWEPGLTNGHSLAGLGMPWLALARSLALLVRFGVLLIAMYVAGVFPSPDDTTAYHLVALMPRVEIGATLPNVSSTLVWAASLFVACTLIWFVPRLVPTAIGSVFISFYRAASEDCREPMERVYRVRVVALAGAIAATLASLIAYYTPSFPREIHALQPVLRSNFWLGIHVLTIVSSYAGALACWCIGNAALVIYLFGSYRRVKLDGSLAAEGEWTGTAGKIEADAFERRPPAICGTLAALNYRAMQVTILLLTAGTILGGLWADVSWGRFWGWDPKETWALNSLLIYLIVVHGRRSGWPSDLSLAAGSVVGFTSIWWAWYGVNFLMAAGLHSYGQGEGGQWWLGLVVAADWALMFAAIIRASSESSRTLPRS